LIDPLHADKSGLLELRLRLLLEFDEDDTFGSTALSVPAVSRSLKVIGYSMKKGF
jgi:hypothetical protein